jgi:hypothetical protein
MINPAYIAEMIRQSREPRSTSRSDSTTDTGSEATTTVLPTPRHGQEAEGVQQQAA